MTPTTHINGDQTIGVTVEDDGTVTISTRDTRADMWSMPTRLTKTDESLTDLTRCEMVEQAWTWLVPNGEIICTEDGEITDDGDLALYLWRVVREFVDMFDSRAEDVTTYGDRGIAVRVAHAMDILWNGPDAYAMTNANGDLAATLS